MVKLRDFEELTCDGEFVPWTLLPVPPRVRGPGDGRPRRVVVDTQRLGANVRPTMDVAGRPEDAEYREATSSEDDDAPRKRARYRPPTSAGTAASDPFSLPPCARCGVAEHRASACPDFSRDRGAAGLPGSTTADLGHDPRPIGMRDAGVEVYSIAAGPDVLYTALSVALRSLGGRFSDAADATRETLATWVSENRRAHVGARTLEGWIAADSDRQWRVRDYVTWVRGQVWSGPIECAAFAASHGVNVHIWRRAPSGSSFLRHAVFEPLDGTAECAVNLLHTHGRHFDVLVRQPARRSRS
jgi:hypothetical protein